ncbi:hypothetical protein [Arenicella xantha]|uniref:Uncharacterized protein n=1 Tax=Arenicella xantha TaxID=644221 RepID=A0A395JJ47_9GAMM|nr:hypothetical protein [Arenicella xantha]RBP48798.1 hypothetical protein DFR28_105137 [Arenicella xantha]
MKYFKIFLNIIIGMIVMASGIVALFSTLAIFENVTTSIRESLVSSAVLAVSLSLAYCLNKPKQGQVLKAFYNTKWWVGLSCFLVVLVGLASLMYVSNQEILSLPVLPSKGSGHITLGELIVIVLLLISLGFVGRTLWRCPKCGKKLPFLTDGKTSKVGFGIKECPSCKVRVTCA